MSDKKDFSKSVTVKNKKARFEYEWLDTYQAGLVLQGTEIKAIRLNKVSLQEAYCYIHRGEVFVKGMHIGLYELGTHYNHEEKRERKLLLKKQEIEKLKKRMEEKGLTLIPTKLYINSRGLAKIEIALAKGKKLHDKRDSIKEKDVKRELSKMKL
ncbi:SsrA-binding protein SmpB [Marivirga arenosa]|uniref:SsrA-binding protein n=1 Tax=Marivirga arenosa TaxID=3059076 RepID=A0AA49GFN0_9BACT|nr:MULTISPECIES: SsrA-binding protein SmpB [unclassified Marivirga]WKK83256.2 SsrA-binding protein SmpB [Marivirga sp. BKB1-2]WMN06428.1 SsrA-binding protein SmpB [Marivirga sp. ABR2-2]